MADTPFSPEPDAGRSPRLMERINAFLDGSGLTLEPDATEIPETIQSLLRELERLRIQYIRQMRELYPEYAALSTGSGPPPARWLSIGPAVVTRGQAHTRPPVAGRTVGIALAPMQQRVYLATANGGVWRSDDDGRSWRSMMEAWDRNPTANTSDTLACGAIAIDPTNPDRVWVGTGEAGGVTFGGIGPVYSADGGRNWTVEAAPASLTGKGFYQLAVDPGDPETVVGATNDGLYCREIHNGAARWVRVRAGIHTSVVVARSRNTTAFYAAHRNGSVYTSPDGKNWTVHGTAGYPGGATYVSLGVRPDYRSVVYALTANSGGAFIGLYRIDTTVDTQWRLVNGVTTPVPNNQARWDLSIAVDPLNTHTLYLGGDTYDRDPTPGREWVSVLRRVRVSKQTSGTTVTWNATERQIGDTVHPDIQVLVTDPSDRNRLWVGCDGGVFRTTNAREATPIFEARNTGLATLMLNALGQHPTQDAVVFSGTQDNGGLRSLGSEVWTHVLGGDSGVMVVNWDFDNNYQVASTTYNNAASRAHDGANGYGSWRIAAGTNGRVPVASQLFYAPMVTTPRNTANTAEANRIAFGGDQIAISSNFGLGPWTLIGTSLPGGEVYASLAFARHNRLFGGGIWGTVRRLDQSGAGTWTETTLPAGLPSARVSGIAVVPGHPDRIYVCLSGRPTLAGSPNANRVWYYDGASWAPRSTGLFDVNHNAIVIDPNDANDIYVGTDIGVWRSTNGGTSWLPWSLGLPDASVKDLMIHGPSRMIRASTHGRSAWERSLDVTEGRHVELWVRDTILDTGRISPTPTNAPDPANQGSTLDPGDSPDIKIDVPSAAGAFQTRTTDIDILEFEQEITDRKNRVGTVTAARGTLNNRVFVQVRSRGYRPADNVQVMLLAAELTGGNPPDLPAGYEAHVQAGTPITGGGWATVGKLPLVGIRDGHARVAGFSLPSTIFPRPNALSGHDRWCLLALLHHADDPFTATERNAATLSRTERKAALKRIRVKAFRGTMPLVPTATAWYRIQPTNANWPLSADPPEFRIFGEENGRATVELAWDPQALLSPSGNYQGNEALRYYTTASPLDKTITKADGTTMQVQVPAQAINLASNRATWTIPEALWEGYRAEAAKGTAGGFTCNLYYRVRVQPSGSPEAIAWPSDRVIQDNVDAPHLGLLNTPTTPTQGFPDAAALAEVEADLRSRLEALYGAQSLATDPARQCLDRILAHANYTAMTPAQRGDVLELWVSSEGPAQGRIDALLERMVWRSRTQTRCALLSVDRRGGKSLAERLVELRHINPHPDLVGVANNAQILDDVITELLDPNGQMNQGDTGMGPVSSLQALLIHVAPAEYVRLMCGLLSTAGRATLANGDTVSVPPTIFQYTRYGSSQTSGFHVRTSSELAFHAALLAYGQGDRFPDYDPSAAPDSDTGAVQAFRAVVRGGLRKAEMTRVAKGLFDVDFTASADGPSATVRNAFTAALDRRLQPLLLSMRWGTTSASTSDIRGHAVLAMRRHEGRVVFKNTHYAGSSPPADVTAGALKTDPPRRIEDPTQSLESISEADLDNVIMWFHEPQRDLVS